MVFFKRIKQYISPTVPLIVVLLLAGVLLNGCSKDAPCETYTFPQCDLIDLSDEYDPVCGCDGVTYTNAGWARCIGGLISYTHGECK